MKEKQPESEIANLCLTKDPEKVIKWETPYFSFCLFVKIKELRECFSRVIK